jgi:hypothetical protein
MVVALCRNMHLFCLLSEFVKHAFSKKLELKQKIGKRKTQAPYILGSLGGLPRGPAKAAPPPLPAAHAGPLPRRGLAAWRPLDPHQRPRPCLPRVGPRPSTPPPRSSLLSFVLPWTPVAIPLPHALILAVKRPLPHRLAVCVRDHRGEPSSSPSPSPSFPFVSRTSPACSRPGALA